MYMYAKFNENIPYGLKVMSIFMNYPQTDGLTELHSDCSAHQSVILNQIFICKVGNKMHCTFSFIVLNL